MRQLRRVRPTPTATARCCRRRPVVGSGWPRAMPPRNSGENAASTAAATPSASSPGAVNATCSAVGGGGSRVVALVTGAERSHARARRDILDAQRARMTPRSCACSRSARCPGRRRSRRRRAHRSATHSRACVSVNVGELESLADPACSLRGRSAVSPGYALYQTCVGI